MSSRKTIFPKGEEKWPKKMRPEGAEERTLAAKCS